MLSLRALSIFVETIFLSYPLLVKYPSRLFSSCFKVSSSVVIRFNLRACEYGNALNVCGG